MATPLTIDFVSDIACPWCVIGLASVTRALDTLQGEVDASLHIRPFELNPQMPAEGEAIDAHLARKYGGPPERFAATREQLRERGAELGFSFGPRTRIWNTFDAHRLLHWARLQQPGSALALKRALLQAYHGRGENPGDPEVLVRAAAAAGLDPAQARERIDSQAYAAEVRTEEAHWQGLGIHAVPSVIINDHHLIQGAQSPEVYAQALRQIASASATVPR